MEAELINCVKMIVDDIEINPHAGCGEITLLCDKYGSDKGSYTNEGHPYPWLAHSYSNVYEALFRKIKNDVKNVFECGIGTNNPNVPSNMTANGRPGASLRVWRDYFKNAQIYGADIDQGCLFQEERIQTAWIDQLSPEAINNYFKSINVKFDIMIDDGLHTSEAAISLLRNALKYLKNGGFYVIEDLTKDQIYEVQSYISNLKGYKVRYAIMDVNGRADNNLVIITK